MAKQEPSNETRGATATEEASLNRPKSQNVSASDFIDVPEDKVEKAVMERKLKSPEVKNAVEFKQKTQKTVNEIASRFALSHKVKDENTQLVWIRAMKTHHPAPTVGDFGFQDVYTHYLEGIRYFVPRYVANHLEETDNAITLD